MNLTRRYQINAFSSQSSDSSASANTVYKKSNRSSIWVMDTIFIPVINKLCVTTSKRDLRFFTLNTEIFIEDFSIYSLPHNANCIDSYYDVIRKSWTYSYII